ncbi:MAG: cyclic pyranopterin monophosphate synthase MoaC [Methanomethylovorans sp.]|nr:cyclic pyranopterin monophosphate synthase MoaC [Methanomethylovorans sp.]
METKLSHLKDDRAIMVDISGKEIIERCATAAGEILLSSQTIERVKNGTIEKGNVLATARTAAILGVKRTPEMIPMCHQIPITGVDVNFSFHEGTIVATVEVRSVGRTGVEMEALTGVSIALLTVWDMVKSVEKDNTGNYPHTSIQNIKVLEKIKGSKTN